MYVHLEKDHNPERLHVCYDVNFPLDDVLPVETLSFSFSLLRGVPHERQKRRRRRSICMHGLTEYHYPGISFLPSLLFYYTPMLSFPSWCCASLTSPTSAYRLQVDSRLSRVQKERERGKALA